MNIQICKKNVKLTLECVLNICSRLWIYLISFIWNAGGFCHPLPLEVQTRAHNHLWKKKRLWNCKKLYSVSIEWTGFFPGWGWRLINLQVKIKMKAIASGLFSHTETSFSFCHPPGFSLALTLLFWLQKSFFKSPGLLRSHVEKLRYSFHIAQQECFVFSLQVMKL